MADSFFPPGMNDDMEALLAKRQAENAEHRRAILESKTNWIADKAWLTWRKDDLFFYLLESPLYREGETMKVENPALHAKLSNLCSFGRFNGYVRFPELPFVAPGLQGIMTYVPVHGGITYFQDWWDGSVTYGFDTGHLVSVENPEIINDIGWMMSETESLGRGIQIAARFEPYYLNATTNERKAVILDRMGKFLPMVVTSNLGVMMNLLFGDL